MTALVDALEVRYGIVCAVGAGGKKSVLYQLVREHSGRVALTATVHTTEFPADLGMQQIIDDDANLQHRVAAADAARCVAYACPSSKPGRHAGAAPETIRAIHDAGGFVATYVKADGARMRWIKAPSSDEPLVVPGADTVIPVVSARAIGEPLTPEAVGRLLASEQGSLQCTAGARVAPVINMVDNEQQEKMARAAASAALAMTSRFDRVVLCCLRRPEGPVVAMVTG